MLQIVGNDRNPLLFGTPSPWLGFLLEGRTGSASRPNPFGPEAEPFGGNPSFAEGSVRPNLRFGSVRLLPNGFGVRSITNAVEVFFFSDLEYFEN